MSNIIGSLLPGSIDEYFGDVRSAQGGCQGVDTLLKGVRFEGGRDEHVCEILFAINDFYVGHTQQLGGTVHFRKIAALANVQTDADRLKTIVAEPKDAKRGVQPSRESKNDLFLHMATNSLKLYSTNSFRTTHPYSVQ